MPRRKNPKFTTFAESIKKIYDLSFHFYENEGEHGNDKNSFALIISCPFAKTSVCALLG